MRKSLGLIAAAVLVAAGAAVAVSPAEPPATTPSPTTSPPASETPPRPPASPDDLARGKALFTGTCAAYCHRSAPAEGAPAAAAGGDAPNLFGCEWRHGGSDEQIFHTISAGVPGTRMVPFGGAIPDDDIGRIVAYLKSATQCKPTL